MKKGLNDPYICLQIVLYKPHPILLEEVREGAYDGYIMGCNARGCKRRSFKSRPHALYCSERCKTRAYRERQRARKVVKEWLPILMIIAIVELLISEKVKQKSNTNVTVLDW